MHVFTLPHGDVRAAITNELFDKSTGSHLILFSFEGYKLPVIIAAWVATPEYLWSFALKLPGIYNFIF